MILNNSINSAKAEAKKSFNDDKVYLEKFLNNSQTYRNPNFS